MLRVTSPQPPLDAQAAPSSNTSLERREISKNEVKDLAALQAQLSKSANDIASTLIEVKMPGG